MGNWNKEEKGYQAGLRRILAGILAAVLIFGNVSPGLPYAFAEETDEEVYIESYAEAEETESEEESEETSEEISEEPTETATEETSEEATSEEITEEASTEDISEEDTSEEASSEEETSEEELSIEPADELAEKPDLEADVEDESDWETLRFCGSTPAEALLAVAESQLGYTESTRNYTEDEDGIRLGYTRYAAWADSENPYAPWNASFVRFCLSYASVELATATSVSQWIEALGAEGYVSAGTYTPNPGDLAFFDSDGDGTPDRVAIVASESTAICGDVDGAVASVSLMELAPAGYAPLPEQFAVIQSDYCGTAPEGVDSSERPKYTLYKNGFVDITGKGTVTSKVKECAYNVPKKVRAKKVRIGSEITELGDSAFYNQWDSFPVAEFDFSIAKNLKTIGIRALSWTPIKTIDLSGCPKLKKIDSYAFNECQELTNIKIQTEEGVTTFISDRAFRSICCIDKTNPDCIFDISGSRGSIFFDSRSFGVGDWNKTVYLNAVRADDVAEVIFNEDLFFGIATQYIYAQNSDMVTLFDRALNRTYAMKAVYLDGSTVGYLGSVPKYTAGGDGTSVECFSVNNANVACFSNGFLSERTSISCNISSTNSVAHIGDSAFYNNQKLPNKLELNMTELTGTGTEVNSDGSVARKVYAPYIGKKAFMDIPNLTEVIIRNTKESDTTTIAEEAFKSDYNIRKIELPAGLKSIGDTSFNGCCSVDELIWNVRDYQGTQEAQGYMNESVFSTDQGFSTGYTLTIGKDVDRLPHYFFEGVKTCGDILFAPNEYISLSGDEFANASIPLCDLSGKLYVDAAGVVYKIENEQAILSYCPPGLSSYTVPTQLQTNKFGTVPVKQVADNAFALARNLEAVHFADASVISRMGSGAFHGLSSLCLVTDAKTDARETTVSGAMALFGENAPRSAFTETGLKDDSSSTGTITGMTPTQTSVSVDNGKINLNVTVFNANEAKWDEARSVYSLLTGEIMGISIAAANQTETEAVTGYVYLNNSNGGLNGLTSFQLADSQTHEVVGSVNMQQTDNPDIKRLEITVNKNATGSCDITLVYPSPASAGGMVQLWAEVPALGQETQKSAYYLQMEWTQKRAERDELGIVTGNSGGKQYASSIGDGEGGRYAAIDMLRWNLTLGESTVQSQKEIGLDPGRRYEYTDVISIPDGVEWSEAAAAGLAKGITIKYGTESRAKVSYVYFGDTHVMSFYWPMSNLVSNGCFVTEMNVTEIKVDGKSGLKLTWQVTPPKDSYETIASLQSIVIQSSALRVDLNKVAGMYGVSTQSDIPYPVELNYLTHDLTAKIIYTHTDPVTLTAKCDETVLLPGPIPSLYKSGANDDKSVVNDRRMGETFHYKLRLMNSGVASTNGFTRLYDDLHPFIYIPAEGIDQMFAEEDGDRLTVTVSDAKYRPYFQNKVMGYNGTPAYQDNTNTADTPAEPLGNLTITKDPDGRVRIRVETAEGQISEEVYPSAAEGLQTLGYVVTARDHYNVDWIMSTDETPITIYGGAQHSTFIRSRFKDTFQNLTQDMNYVFSGKENWWTNIRNIAYANHQSQSISGICNVNYFREDATIQLSLKHNGSSVDGNNLSGINFKSGSILDYTLAATHYGGGEMKNLPVIQNLTGSQVLLARVDLNSDLEAENLEKFTDSNGTEYYLLADTSTEAERTFRNVKLGPSKDNPQIADTVTVTPIAGGNGQNTVIHWFIPSFTQTAATSFTPRTVLQSDKPRFSFSSNAFLNDVVDDHLTATIGTGYGSQLSFKKQIVTGSPNLDGNSTGEMLDFDGFTVLTKDNHHVTYKLTMGNYSASPYVINGKSLFDRFPCTYGVFDWTEENVSVVIRTEGNVETTAALNEWYLTTEPPVYYLSEAMERTFLCWPKETLATLNPNSALVIYVTLDYTGKADQTDQADQDDQWENYVEKAKGELIHNTLYLDEVPEDVAHELKAVQRGILQKGVLRISQIGPTDSKEYYNNVESHIEYYVTLYNGGSTRLYVNNLTDTLPKGFTYRCISPSGGYVINNTYNYITTVRGRQLTVQGAPVRITDSIRGDNEISFVSANITPSVNNRIITFAISGDTSNQDGFLSYNDKEKQYYLNPGEAIAFCYSCDIDRNESKTEDSAENRIQMEVSDPESCGIRVYNKASITSAVLSALTPNDGSCAVTSNGKFKQLTSDVIVRRGKILPGISKKLSSYVDPTTHKEISQFTVVPPGAQLNWVITTYNDSYREINGYSIEDTMEYPYRVSGAVTYKLLSSDGSLASAPFRGAGSSDSSVLPLFYVTDRNEEEHSITITDVTGKVHVIHSNGEDNTASVPLTYIRERLNGVLRSSYTLSDGAYAGEIGRTKDANGKDILLQVSFRWDEETCKETMRITFPTAVLVHMPHCTGVLNLTTTRANNIFENTTYMNVARLLPANTDYEADMVRNGIPLTSSSGEATVNVGVEANSMVTVATGYATIGNKNVTELGSTNPDTTIHQNAPLEDYYLLKEKDSIVLPAKEDNAFHDVRYTLTVRNVSSTNEDFMSELVLIDNLPEIGDNFTLRSNVSRYSEFLVNFAESAEPKMWIHNNDYGSSTEHDVILSPDQFTVEYSEKTSFDSADWSGNGTGWHTEKGSADRSIRFVLRDTTTDYRYAIMPRNSTVCASFDASISAEGVEPGMTANNSFAYSYKIRGQVLQASSQQVGVKIAADPFLRKSLVDLHGRAFKAEKDETFRFLIYEGEAIAELDGKTEAEQMQAITAAGRKYLLKDITVEKGKSSSNGIRLEETADFRWVSGSTYTFTELPTAREFRLNRWTGFTECFVYNPGENQIITAENTMCRWTLELEKISAVNNRRLPGAIFALYSPNPVDTITDYDAACTLAGKEIPTVIQTESAVPGEMESWHLMEVVQTQDSILSWTVVENRYLLRELVAPAGYRLLQEDIIVSNTSIGADNTKATVTAINYAGYSIPGTGGMGTLPLYLGGWALLLSASAIMLLRRKRRRA